MTKPVSKPATKAVKATTPVKNERLVAIEGELTTLKQKREAVTEWVNSLTVVGRKAKKAHARVLKRIYEQEQLLNKERVNVMKASVKGGKK
ncbi:MAG: hypothetical protein ACK5LJ_08105 [Paracoccus sp. (in: a-proteobacteria)]